MRDLDRRTALASLAAGGIMASTSARAAEPIAKTTLGRLRGVDLGGCLAFRGVRYAVADRFAAPEPQAIMQ